MNISRLLISIFALLLISACSAGPIETSEPGPNESGETAELAEPPEAQEPASGPTRTPVSSDKYSDLEIITLLPQDAIPAIDNPEFLTSAEADDEYAPDELVIGVEFNGDARAYSISYLSRFEIVNDTVGGVALSVTW